jgi:hypothetical protein
MSRFSRLHQDSAGSKKRLCVKTLRHACMWSSGCASHDGGEQTWYPWVVPGKSFFSTSGSPKPVLVILFSPVPGLSTSTMLSFLDPISDWLRPCLDCRAMGWGVTKALAVPARSAVAATHWLVVGIVRCSSWRCRLVHIGEPRKLSKTAPARCDQWESILELVALRYFRKRSFS